jgi:hypothetical protein
MQKMRYIVAGNRLNRFPLSMAGFCQILHEFREHARSDHVAELDLLEGRIWRFDDSTRPVAGILFRIGGIAFTRFYLPLFTEGSPYIISLGNRGRNNEQTIGPGSRYA